MKIKTYINYFNLFLIYYQETYAKIRNFIMYLVNFRQNIKIQRINLNRKNIMEKEITKKEFILKIGNIRDTRAVAETVRTIFNEPTL